MNLQLFAFQNNYCVYRPKLENMKIKNFLSNFFSINYGCLIQPRLWLCHTRKARSLHHRVSASNAKRHGQSLRTAPNMKSDSFQMLFYMILV